MNEETIDESGSDQASAATEVESVEASAPEVDNGSTTEVEGGEAVGEANKTQPVEDEESAFEIAKGIALKTGMPLTEQHLDEIRKGFMKFSDYTRKTQELSALRQEANQTLTARDEILQDPKALRKYVKDEWIMQAFNPQELLVNALTQNQVPPELWNQFLEQWQQSGGQSNDAWKADPWAQKFEGLNKQITSLQSKLQQREQAEMKAREEAEKNKQFSELRKEIDEAVKGEPGVTAKEILFKLAYEDVGHLTIKQLVKRIAKEKDDFIQQRSEALKQKNLNSPKPPKGGTIPIMPKAPKTFDEAFEHGMAGMGAS